jgi:site-specific DNA-cytosine methylase
MNFATWDEMMEGLESCVPFVEYKAINACDRNTPQRFRKRAFAFAADPLHGVMLQWPEARPWDGSLQDILEENGGGDEMSRLHATKGDCRERNLVNIAFAKMHSNAMTTAKGDKMKARRLYKKYCKNLLVDIGCTPKYAQVTQGCFPTITKTRAGAFAYWVVKKGKRVSLRELFRGFAIPEEHIDRFIRKAKEEKRQPATLAGMVGNSVAYPVAKALLDPVVKCMN